MRGDAEGVRSAYVVHGPTATAAYRIDASRSDPTRPDHSTSSSQHVKPIAAERSRRGTARCKFTINYGSPPTPPCEAQCVVWCPCPPAAAAPPTRSCPSIVHAHIQNNPYCTVGIDIKIQRLGEQIKRSSRSNDAPPQRGRTVGIESTKDVILPATLVREITARHPLLLPRTRTLRCRRRPPSAAAVTTMARTARKARDERAGPACSAPAPRRTTVAGDGPASCAASRSSSRSVVAPCAPAPVSPLRTISAPSSRTELASSTRAGGKSPRLSTRYMPPFAAAMRAPRLIPTCARSAGACRCCGSTSRRRRGGNTSSEVEKKINVYTYYYLNVYDKCYAAVSFAIYTHL